MEEYELTEEEILGIEEDNRKDEIIRLYKATLEDVYEILANIKDYEADINEMKDLIKSCEIEVAKC